MPVNSIEWVGEREGWLNKFSEGRLGFTKWQKRFFILESNSLKYLDREGGQVRRVFALESISDVVATSKQFELQLIFTQEAAGGSHNPFARTSSRGSSPMKQRTSYLGSPRPGYDKHSIPDSLIGPKHSTLLLAAETEDMRNTWVESIKMAVLKRRANMSAVQVAIERLRANTVQWGQLLSLPDILDQFVREDKSKEYGLVDSNSIYFTCTDDDVVSLADALSGNTSVTALSLAAGQMGGMLSDRGATTLSGALSSNTSLVSLSLNNNSIGDQGALAMLLSATTNNLAVLDLDGNSRITHEGVQQLYDSIAQIGGRPEGFNLRLPQQSLAQRALAGNVGYGLKQGEAEKLRQTVWPANVDDPEVMLKIRETWGIQGLEFAPADSVVGANGRLEFGLQQHRTGPCGVVAAVQAQIFGLMLWPEDYTDGAVGLTQPTDKMDWERLGAEMFSVVSKSILASSVATILWRCRADTSAGAKLVTVEGGGELELGPSRWELLRVIDCNTFEQLRAMTAEILDTFVKPGGAILLMYSAVLTRGVDRVWDEIGNVGKVPGAAHAQGGSPKMVGGSPRLNQLVGGLGGSPKWQTSQGGPPSGGSPFFDAHNTMHTLVVMEGGWAYCEQALVNLLLCGTALPSLDPPEQSPIGFLTCTEQLVSASTPEAQLSHVSSNYKTPKTPVWVVHGGNHYTVLIARSRTILYEAEPGSMPVGGGNAGGGTRFPSGGGEREYVIEHFNALPPAGPRITKLFLKFSDPDLGDGADLDDDEERRRWSCAEGDSPKGTGVKEDARQALLSLIPPRIVKLSSVVVMKMGVMEGPVQHKGMDVAARDIEELVQSVCQTLVINDLATEPLQFKLASESTAHWRPIGEDTSVLPQVGAELLVRVKAGAKDSPPDPPVLEKLQLRGVFHVCDRRSTGCGLEFEVALDGLSEARVLWSLFFHMSSTQQLSSSFDMECVSEHEHKLAVLPGMMPQIVCDQPAEGSVYYPLALVKQGCKDRWRCRQCSLQLQQPNISEEDLFRFLCAVNDARSPACKSCGKSVEMCGRALWIPYEVLPKDVRLHIDASDRWRPHQTQTIPPILHVLRTRWNRVSVRPGPLWPSKGGPSL